MRLKTVRPINYLIHIILLVVSLSELLKSHNSLAKMIMFYGMTSIETSLLLAALFTAGMIAILGSAYTFSFYLKKKSVVALLYKYMAIFDIFSGTNAIFFVILSLTYLRDCNTSFYTAKEKWSDLRTEEDLAAINGTASGCHRDSSLVTITFIITAVFTRVPMFIGVLLSVIRSINIRDPFYQPNRNALTVSITFWTVTWTAMAIAASQIPIKFIYDETYKMKDSFYRLLVNNVTPLEIGSIQAWQYMFVMMLSFLFPIVIMLASTVTQLGILFQTRIGSVTSDHIYMTGTIIIITGITVVCAMPSSMYVAASWAKIGAVSSGYFLDASLAFLYGFGLPVLNSALNPVVLICRSSAMRSHWRTISGRNISNRSERTGTE